MTLLRRTTLILLLICSFALAVLAQGSGMLPDNTKTPGATLAVTKKDTCVPGYTKTVRNVPISLKREVFAEYGIPWEKHTDYEVDHLISLVLGGSNAKINLWPQSYKTVWNARVKDRLETKMGRMVCKNQITLKQAQEEISTDWVAAYKKYIGPSPKSLKTPKGWGIQ
jgi:hypothetical protein